MHVVRCFEDENITHVESTVDPVRDIGTINLELILADMETVQRRLDRAKNSAKGGDKKFLVEAEFLQRVYDHLSKEQCAIYFCSPPSPSSTRRTSRRRTWARRTRSFPS